ncbi:MAG: hypothetical protein H6Q71_2666 [Firmicutes bacterium]|nr:hypothetical protein [Bacillota bacterium]
MFLEFLEKKGCGSGQMEVKMIKWGDVDKIGKMVISAQYDNAKGSRLKDLN